MKESAFAMRGRLIADCAILKRSMIAKMVKRLLHDTMTRMATIAKNACYTVAVTKSSVKAAMETRESASTRGLMVTLVM